ncbi:glycosyltransferase [Bacillus sp. FJAT-45037]|uniref:glycosyltransferase n=1 Tax=Bacillus sp. FJAT-45037 TaxID=2011007 RepID=UPI001E4D663E|nr:glycosyltransferase [Bacillus sp. FJAT-45037]
MMIMTLVLVLVFLLGWTIINRSFIPSLPKVVKNNSDSPLISVMVPLRNEERNVQGLIQSFSQLSYPNLEFIFLDDGSDDQTGELLKRWSKTLPNAKILLGKPLPEGWVGKVHACKQLGQAAKGDYLAFIDADIRLAPETFDQSLELLRLKQAGLLTGFPHFPTTSFLSKLLVPLQHMIVILHLPLFMANHSTKPAFTAAHGAFMFFKRQAYVDAGGHEAVKNSLVEDVHLTRAVKRSGHRAILGSVTSSVTCYMYESNQEVWDGFSKNIFPGIGRSIPLAIMLSIFYLLLFVLPLPVAIIGVINSDWLALLPLALTLLIRFYIDWSMKQERWLWVLMPLSAVSLLLVLYRSMYLSIRGYGFTWKGRRYS